MSRPITHHGEMRRDVFIRNSTGALSVLAGDAADAIIADRRDGDHTVVAGHNSLLVVLQDDSMPVRIVVDEPLGPEEAGPWLPQASWRIDAPDGRVLITGAFDPAALAWWKEETGGHGDGLGVALVTVPRGNLRVDVYGRAGSTIGFLIQIRRWQDAAGMPPDDDWFARDVAIQAPEVFPLGLAPNGRKIAGVISGWAGEPPSAIDGPTPIAIDLADTHLLHWLTSLASDSPPHFEFWIQGGIPWPLPAQTSEYAVLTNPEIVVIASPSNRTGWWLVRGCRRAAAALAPVPDGTAIDLGMARASTDDTVRPDVGRALFSGVVRAGRLHLVQASPPVDRHTLDAALQFATELLTERRITALTASEREAVAARTGVHAPGEGAVEWDGDTIRINDPDDRTLMMLASPVFRRRFGSVWPCDDEGEW